MIGKSRGGTKKPHEVNWESFEGDSMTSDFQTFIILCRWYNIVVHLFYKQNPSDILILHYTYYTTTFKQNFLVCE